MEIVISKLYLSEFVTTNSHLISMDNIVKIEPIDEDYINVIIKPRHIRE